MSLWDRVLDAVASAFAPTVDHPAGGGVTGDEPADDGVEESDDGSVDGSRNDGVEGSPDADRD